VVHCSFEESGVGRHCCKYIYTSTARLAITAVLSLGNFDCLLSFAIVVVVDRRKSGRWREGCRNGQDSCVALFVDN
jgi:hypothetical protein